MLGAARSCLGGLLVGDLLVLHHLLGSDAIEAWIGSQNKLQIVSMGLPWSAVYLLQARQLCLAYHSH